MSNANHNPIAAALRSGRVTRCNTIPPRKGKGAPHRRQPKHKGRAWA